MENQIDQEKDERLADKLVNRLLWFIFGVLLGVIMVKLF